MRMIVAENHDDWILPWGLPTCMTFVKDAGYYNGNTM
jgi:hypothetical protein